MTTPAAGLPARRVALAIAATVALLAPATTALAAGPSAPAPATCATVAAGSRGPVVAALQRMLRVTADGDFGPATASALRTWQKAHRLRPNGTVDAATWRVVPAAAQLCGLRATKLVPAAKGPCRSLSRGMSGPAVAAVQVRLKVTALGYYGPLTTAAVTALQRRARISPPGPVGPRTWTALGLVGTPACPSATTGVEAVSTTRPSPVPSPTPGAAPTPAPTPTSDPVLDARRAAIRTQVAATVTALMTSPTTTSDPTAATAVRSALGMLGKPYLWGGASPAGFDCSGLVLWSYGSAGLQLSRVAADQYAGGRLMPLAQARPGDVLFWATDVLDPRTIFHDAIYLGAGRLVEAPRSTIPVRVRTLSGSTLLPMVARPSALLTLPVGSGATGWTVRQVQRALVATGHAVTVDGGYGAQTASAVKAVQQAARLPVTGVVDVTTWNALTRDHV